MSRLARSPIGEVISLPVGLVLRNAHVFTDTVSLGRKVGYSLKWIVPPYTKCEGLWLSQEVVARRVLTHTNRSESLTVS